MLAVVGVYSDDAETSSCWPSDGRNDVELLNLVRMLTIRLELDLLRSSTACSVLQEFSSQG